MKMKALLTIIAIIAAASGCASKDDLQPLELISTEEISQRKRDEIAMMQSQLQSVPPQPQAASAPSDLPDEQGPEV